jgi:hypothetical protein
MLDAPQQSTISRLSRLPVAGKPFVVGEYNHPFPNEYGCEMPLLLAAYASLQDWDAVYGYTFLDSHPWTEKDLSGDSVPGWFDLANDVAKMAQMPTAARMFLRSDVRPANKVLTVAYDEDRVFDSVRAKRGVKFHATGELSPLLSLVHRFRIERFDAPQTTRAEDVGFQAPKGRIESDTGQLAWEAGDRGAGRLTINTPQVQAALGWLGGKRATTADVEFRLTTPFAAVSLAALDGETLSRSKKILLVAAARCANTGMEWNKARTSIGKRWGGPPLVIEQVEGQVAVGRDKDAPKLWLTPLDGCGRARVGQARPATAEERRELFDLQGADATMWYLLAPSPIKRNGENARKGQP